MNDIEPRCINLYVWDGLRERERSFQDRIYRTDFIAPAITTAFRPWYLVMEDKPEIIIVGRLECKGFDLMKRVYSTKGICPTLNCCGGGNLQPKILVEQEIVAMRGRNPEKPTDRTAGQPTEQMLEKNSKGLCNTLTTVGKDNLVMETIRVGQISNEGSQAGQVYSEDGLSMTLCAGTHGYAMGNILIKQATEKGFIEMENGGVADLSYPESSTSRGRVQDNGNICPTLTAQTQEIYKIDRQVVEQRSDEGIREFNGEVSGALRTTDSCGDKRVIEKKVVAEVEKIGSLSDFAMAENVYEKDKISPTLTAGMSHGKNIQLITDDPKIYRQAQEPFEENNCEPGDCINPFNKSVDKSGCSPTITTRPEGMKTAVIPVTYDYRIRKLTPLECFRLMGVTDEDAHKMLSVNSNSQCYKQAGNSIVVDVMAAMFSRLF